MCSSQEEETLTTTTATATKTSLKKWIRAASNFIALIPSISFNSPKVGKVFWSWILEDCIKVQEKKKKVLPCVPVLDKTWNYRLRNVQKSVMHMQSCCFANLTYHIFAVLVAVAVIVALSSLISWREVELAHQNGTSENRECFGPNRFQATTLFVRNKCGSNLSPFWPKLAFESVTAFAHVGSNCDLKRSSDCAELMALGK